MAKKIVPLVVIVFFLFAAIIGLTDEPKTSSPELKEAETSSDFPFSSEFERKMPEWGSPAHWFRSNAGGLTIEEVPSRLTALRNEYALAIGFPHQDELPEYLLSYYDEEEHNIETRTLYKNGEQIRTQWLFRDKNGTTRLNAVFLEPEKPNVQEEIKQEEIKSDEITEEEIIEEETLAEEELGIDKEEEEIVEIAVSEKESKIVKEKHKTGFIEIFDKNMFLTREYRFFENGDVNKTDYVFSGGILISSKVSLSEDGGKEYKETYTDFYRYNRSSSLRAVERKFSRDGKISLSDAPLLITFPRRIGDAAKNGTFISERHNSYPDFFGDVPVHADSKIVFETDERSRVLSQTLYDEKADVVWVIRNTWQNNRIISTTKTEGGTVLLAEYSYNSKGDRILERNLRNGVLERVVRMEGKNDIEELYFNNVLVLRAVWEDGRKISETRVK